MTKFVGIQFFAFCTPIRSIYRKQLLTTFLFFRNKANNIFLVNCLETAYVTGQNDRQTQILSRQIVVLAGLCPVTVRYFEP